MKLLLLLLLTYNVAYSQESNLLIKTKYNIKVLVDSSYFHLPPYYVNRKTDTPFTGWYFEERLKGGFNLTQVFEGHHKGIIYTYNRGRKFYYLKRIIVGENYYATCTIYYKKKEEFKKIKDVYIYSYSGDDNLWERIKYKKNGYKVTVVKKDNSGKKIKNKKTLEVFNNNLINQYNNQLLFPVRIRNILDLFD